LRREIEHANHITTASRLAVALSCHSMRYINTRGFVDNVSVKFDNFRFGEAPIVVIA
jgi:hypothetical protein